jgi:hypothetical protein
MPQYENAQQVASQMKAVLDRIVQAKNSPAEVQRAAEEGKRQLDQFSQQDQGQQGQGQPGGQQDSSMIQELRRNMDELRQRVDQLIRNQGYSGQQGGQQGWQQPQQPQGGPWQQGGPPWQQGRGR